MVTVSASDLPGNAVAFVDVVRAAAIAGEARNVTIDSSQDGRELTVSFTVDAVDDETASELGQDVLEAVDADFFT